MAGRLIVFEGTDGSGKSTQFRALCDRAARSGHSFQKLVFPQYSEPSSALIRMYLGGEFGSHPGDVNPYAASSFYAVDRYASFKKVWGTFYQSGGLVLTDRYTTSNAVHQAVKCAPEEREAFLTGWTILSITKWGFHVPIWSFTWICPLTAPSPCSGSGRATPTPRRTSTSWIPAICPPAAPAPSRPPSC